jgi:hypothetical protein
MNRKESLNGNLPAELARLRALHHVHDSARILTDSVTSFPIEKRKAVGEIIRSAEALEGKLKDLEVVGE